MKHCCSLFQLSKVGFSCSCINQIICLDASVEHGSVHLGYFLCLWNPSLDCITAILSIKMTSVQMLVVLHTTPPMFGKFLVHAWRWCGDLDEDHRY